MDAPQELPVPWDAGYSAINDPLELVGIKCQGCGCFEFMYADSEKFAGIKAKGFGLRIHGCIYGGNCNCHHGYGKTRSVLLVKRETL